MAQSYVYTAEGRKRKTLYGKTRNEVSGKLTKAMSDRDGELIFDAGKMTLGEPDRFHTLYVLAVHTGMRPGELLAHNVHPKYVQELFGHASITLSLLHLLPRLARHGRRRCLRHGSSVVQMLDLFAPEVSTPDSSLLYRP